MPTGCKERVHGSTPIEQFSRGSTSRGPNALVHATHEAGSHVPPSCQYLATRNELEVTIFFGRTRIANANLSMCDATAFTAPMFRGAHDAAQRLEIGSWTDESEAAHREMPQIRTCIESMCSQCTTETIEFSEGEVVGEALENDGMIHAVFGTLGYWVLQKLVKTTTPRVLHGGQIAYGKRGPVDHHMTYRNAIYDFKEAHPLPRRLHRSVRQRQKHAPVRTVGKQCYDITFVSEDYHTSEIRKSWHAFAHTSASDSCRIKSRCGVSVSPPPDTSDMP